MTSPRRFEHDLPALLADLYLQGTPDYRDDLVQQIARVRQRPAWTFPERWLPMDLATKALPGAPRVPWRIVGVLRAPGSPARGDARVLRGLAAAVPAVPFGPAANGSIAFGQDGDIYTADPSDRQGDRDRGRPGGRRSTRLLAGRHSSRLRTQGRGRWRRPARVPVRRPGTTDVGSSRSRPSRSAVSPPGASRPTAARSSRWPLANRTHDHGRGERRQRPTGVLRCRGNVE